MFLTHALKKCMALQTCVQVISEEKLSHNEHLSHLLASTGQQPAPEKKNNNLDPLVQIWVNHICSGGLQINTHCSDYMLFKLNGQVGPRIFVPLHAATKMWVSIFSPRSFSSPCILVSFEEQ